MSEKSNGNGKSSLLIVLVLLTCVYFFTGFFVIQPIGAIPEGVTIWYLRAGLNIPFISSADGILLKQDKSVNLLGRGLLMGSVTTLIKDRIIVRLPYMDFMYSISTGGVEFEK